MADDIIKEVKGFVDPGSNVDPIRGGIVEDVQGKAFNEIQAREIKQPDWIPPTVLKNEELDPAKVFDLKIPERFDIQPDSTVWNEGMITKGTSDVINNRSSVDQTKTNARSSYLTEIKNRENPSKVGFQTANGVSKFMPIASSEGTGPDKDIMSKFEIGYGIKIPKVWLGADEDKWPVVQGVSVNIRNGLTDEQATAMSKDIMDKSYASAGKTVSGWKNLSENEKTYWADLAYNGGSGAIKKNKRAMKAAEKGLSVEAMIDVFHFIGSGGKRSRGLLNRRLSMYNQAALSISGAPVATSYEVKDGLVFIQFANGFMTNKISKKMSDKITKNGNKYIMKEPFEKGSWKADKIYKFER